MAAKTTPCERELAKLQRAQASMATAYTVADAKAAKRNAQMLAAVNAGATYDQVKDITGLATSRVSQVLKRERQGAGS